jgi:hypothetical protein
VSGRCIRLIDRDVVAIRICVCHREAGSFINNFVIVYFPVLHNSNGMGVNTSWQYFRVKLIPALRGPRADLFDKLSEVIWVLDHLLFSARLGGLAGQLLWLSFELRCDGLCEVSSTHAAVRRTLHGASPVVAGGSSALAGFVAWVVLQLPSFSQSHPWHEFIFEQDPLTGTVRTINNFWRFKIRDLQTAMAVWASRVEVTFCFHYFLLRFAHEPASFIWESLLRSSRSRWLHSCRLCSRYNGLPSRNFSLV